MNRNIASVHKFQVEFPHFNESTVREFKRKYKTEKLRTPQRRREKQ